jgi:zinc protease
MTPMLSRRRVWRAAFAAGVTVSLAAPAQSQAPATIRPLTYTRVVLPNGLVAILNEDHSSPIIGVQVSYHIGAKDEPKGRTGFAHLCEHLMFDGSPNVPAGQFMSIVRAGGGTSTRWAETTEDRTIFYETVPSNQLETILWLESDRMLRPFMHTDSTRLDVVRGIIKNERQANREGVPFGLANSVTLEALYGGENPYRDPVGPMDDINRATFGEIRQFCAPYYAPNNAVIALSGDFDTAKAKALVTKYFGEIKRGAPVKHPAMRPTPMSGERRLVLEDARARVPRLRIAWAGASFTNPDKNALNALASALQGDRSAGLTKALVYDRQLATGVFVFAADLENGGVFQIEAAPRGTTPLGVLEDVIDSVVRVAIEIPPTEKQLRHFKNSNAINAITGLQSRVMRADTLTQGESWANDPVTYAKQVNAASKLTPEQVRQAARKYLVPGRVVMSMVPAGKLDLISKPERKYERPLAATPPGGAK